MTVYGIAGLSNMSILIQIINDKFFQKNVKMHQFCGKYFGSPIYLYYIYK